MGITLDKYGKDLLEKIREVRQMEESQVTDLVVRYYQFDWYYNYTDDINVWRNAKALKEEMDNDAKKILGDSADFFLSLTPDMAHKQLEEKYPWVKYYIYKHSSPHNQVGLVLDNIPEQTISRANRILELIHGIAKEPSMAQCSMRFIYTPKTPNPVFMRQTALECRNPAYFGYTPAPHVLEKIKASHAILSDYKAIGIIREYAMNQHYADIHDVPMLWITLNTDPVFKIPVMLVRGNINFNLFV